MRNKKTLRVFAALTTAAVLMCGMMAAPVTAYAFTDEEETAVTETAPEATPEPTPTPEPVPLTPPGNLTLVDDISGGQASDKQFITVVTKSGNYFYLVIDRAGDKENVHFMNLVDEADLLAIIEEDKKAVTPAPAEPTPEATTVTPEQTPAPEPEKANSTGSILILLLLAGALGGGAFYYFKVLKPKQAAKGTAVTELDEFDFDEDEEDSGLETGGEETPDFAEDGEPVPDFTFDTGGYDTETPESEEK